jgi:hypothetical protein
MRPDFARLLIFCGVTAIGSLFFGAYPAFADAIDGTWCSTKDHRQLTIAGSDAILPGGRHVNGEYSRHRFAYLIPMPDADAGRPMVLSLLGETNMVSVSPSPDGIATSEPESWKRCELTS